MELHDALTLESYAREARVHAVQLQAGDAARVARLAELLTSEASVLELGCGAGADSVRLRAHGLMVSGADGSPEIAAEAEHRTGQPIRILRFDALDAEA